MKKTIVVTQPLDLYHDQIKRLKSLGSVTLYNTMPKSPEEWMERCKNADIICTGFYGLREKIYELQDKFISLPFVRTGWLNIEKCKKRNIIVSNCPGCNKEPVSEWIIGMMILMLRKLDKFIKCKEKSRSELLKPTSGLSGKNVSILGAGNVGVTVGKICEAFSMNVNYFRRGDDIFKCVKNADIVIDCLGHNPTTENILDKKFFFSMKKGSYFISVTGSEIVDADALIETLNKGIIVCAGYDAGNIKGGDTEDPYYKKLLKHPKILVTPHIAFNTDTKARKANDMMIDNIEAWLKGKPINVITK